MKSHSSIAPSSRAKGADPPSKSHRPKSEAEADHGAPPKRAEVILHITYLSLKVAEAAVAVFHVLL
jgi:hypothetical protein